MPLSIVAVTACATGIAQTYMAADVLERCARQRGYGIKVETQGAFGTLNALSTLDIQAADVAILTTDIPIEQSYRFESVRTLYVSIDELLMDPHRVLDSVIEQQ